MEQTGVVLLLLTIAGMLGGLVGTFARRSPWINNKFVPLITVVATALANVVLVMRKFLEAAGAPVAWFDGSGVALAGVNWGVFVSIALAILTALKAQLPLQRLSFENGESKVLYPNRISEPVVTQTVAQAETAMAAKA